MRYEPRHLNLHVTNKCNNYCRFCYISATQHDKNEFFLDSNIMIRTINEFSKCSLNPNAKIVFTGGEPTLKFNDILNTLSYIQESHINYSPVMFTNGGLLGAIGKYRKNKVISHMLNFSGLNKHTPKSAVNELKKAGLNGITVSVDANHTSFNDNLKCHQVPLYCIKELFDQLLDQGYGTAENELILDVSYSDAEKQKSEEIIENLISHLNFKKKGNDYIKDNQIIIRRGVVGFTLVGRVGETNVEQLKLEDALDLTCEKLNGKKEGYGPLCFNYEHGPDIDSNGDVYFCNGQSFLIGNIFEDNLQNIFLALNTNHSINEKYGANIKILNFMSNFTKQNKRNCIGETLNILIQKEPDLLKTINNAAGLCWNLGRNKDLQQIILNYIINY
ncbi:radical SAM protein [Candidatus Woesearchaeota archaeon]|jgi:hypothetical protein|nr:radical SAM protein [Candidatus Woesearchaeota archaeon]MBT6519354.1 radical SAM protein [Candidatus Woesearchaeota archaeon]MBT7366815.1 radical SAM protein [Candidatus Woesearchaeota archaeon]